MYAPGGAADLSSEVQSIARLRLERVSQGARVHEVVLHIITRLRNLALFQTFTKREGEGEGEGVLTKEENRPKRSQVHNLRWTAKS